MNTSATLTPINNVISKPQDYGEFQYLNSDSTFSFGTSEKLTPGEAWKASISGITGKANGFIEDNTTITLCGGGTDKPVVLGYTIEPLEILDNDSATCWPPKCRAYFSRALLDWYYEYDMDERKALGTQIAMKELSDLKKWDNMQRPRTQSNRHGYRRTR